MKQKLFLALLLIFTIKSFSQDSKVSLELNYPIPIDNNFFGKNYNGVIDFGLKYRFSNLDYLNIGVSLNASFFDDTFKALDVITFSVQPRIFTELNMESLSKLHPSVGLGYTFIIFNASGIDGFNPDNPNSSSSSQTESGINLNLGIAYDITYRLFAQVQYDFVKLGIDKEVPNIKYNTNINILKIGIGYRL